MKLKILTGALALLLTGSVLTGFSTQAAPSKAESDDHLAQEISEAVFRMDGATAQVSYDGGSTWDTSPTVELPDSTAMKNLLDGLKLKATTYRRL